MAVAAIMHFNVLRPILGQIQTAEFGRVELSTAGVGYWCSGGLIGPVMVMPHKVVKFF